MATEIKNQSHITQEAADQYYNLKVQSCKLKKD